MMLLAWCTEPVMYIAVMLLHDTGHGNCSELHVDAYVNKLLSTPIQGGVAAVTLPEL